MAQLHFYSLVRARDAFTYMRNTQHQFQDVQMVVHKQQEGEEGNANEKQADEENKSESLDSDDSDYEQKKRAKELKKLDVDGFQIVS
mmetsp:Transcript_15755/g.26591  ORF Transcript_15755/g.26591 Transcript_15755/m.26591 type:complete len:87 (-) Transcript_15755:38-298(-)